MPIAHIRRGVAIAVSCAAVWLSERSPALGAEDVGVRPTVSPRNMSTVKTDQSAGVLVIRCWDEHQNYLGGTMIGRGLASRGRRRCAVALAATLVVTGSVVGVTVAAASPASSGPSASGPVTSSVGPKSAAPMNINPGKTPVLTPPSPGAVVHGPALSIAERKAAAQRELAKDPNGTTICFLADGSVAGTVKVDKVHPTEPLSPVESAGICARGWTGSTP